SAGELDALDQVQRRVGRRWKQALRRAWESGDYRDIAPASEYIVSLLQGLRNASYFGPSGLAAHRAGPPPTGPPDVAIGPNHVGYEAVLPFVEQQRLGVTVPPGRAFYGASEQAAVKTVKAWLAEQGVTVPPVTHRRLGY